VGALLLGALGLLAAGLAYGGVGAPAGVFKKPPQTAALKTIPRPPIARAGDPPPTRPCPRRCLRTPGTRINTVQDLLRWAAKDVDAFWKSQVADTPVKWTKPKLVIINPGQQKQTSCGLIDKDGGPGYCYGDQTVYMPLGWLKNNVYPGSGFRAVDFALTVIVAHEFGHHLQHVNPRWKYTYIIQAELQADCFAGLWAYNTWHRTLIDDSDLNEASHALGEAADPDHGTGVQRILWFSFGQLRGVASACDTSKVTPAS
jgi:predicted metalloprotease